MSSTIRKRWKRSRNRQEVNRINSIHIVRYSWTASTQTHSRPAHKDLRENADTVASRAAVVIAKRSSHARKRNGGGTSFKYKRDFTRTCVIIRASATFKFSLSQRNQQILSCKHPARVAVGRLYSNSFFSAIRTYR